MFTSGDWFKKIIVVSLLSLMPMAMVPSVNAGEIITPLNESPPKSSIVESVNINSANAEELAATLQGIGLTKAKAIVDWRQQHGEFKQVEDLLKVKGIGKKILAINKERVEL